MFPYSALTKEHFEKKDEKPGLTDRAPASPDTRLAVFSFTHFAVDLCCIFLMSAIAFPQSLGKVEWAVCVLVYNFFAFAVQLPVGAFCDLNKRPRELAALGCGLVSLAFLVARYTGAPVLTGVVAGIGNSCFHVGGGVDTLEQSGGRAARPGIFVATGAFGVYLARRLAGMEGIAGPASVFGIVLMIISAYLILSLGRSGEAAEEGRETGIGQATGSATPMGRSVSRSAAWICGTLLFITVLFRSYCGYLMGWGWKSVPLLGLLFTLGVVGGKMAGGLIGDRIGWEKSSIISLALAALLFRFAPGSPAAGIAGVLLFNMTMPITLTALARIMGREYYGTAFGLTTIALFMGTVPFTIGAPAFLADPPEWLLIALTSLSLAAICGGITPVRRQPAGPAGADSNGQEEASDNE